VGLRLHVQLHIEELYELIPVGTPVLIQE